MEERWLHTIPISKYTLFKFDLRWFPYESKNENKGRLNITECLDSQGRPLDIRASDVVSCTFLHF